MKKQIKGFTLVEVMIVVAVIGIIAAVAYPAYQRHTMTTYRTAVTACMYQHAQRLERNYSATLTYNTNRNKAAYQLEALECNKDISKQYDLTLPTDKLTASSFILQATPKTGSIASRDSVCKTLTLNEKGVRTANGKSDTATIQQCW